MTSRNSRRLDLNLDSSDLAPSLVGASPDHPELQKNELRKLFETEIAEIVAERSAIIELELKQKFEKKLEGFKQDYEDQLAAKSAALDEDKSKFSSLYASLKNSYQNKISEDIVMLDEIVIDIAMQVLYRILGNDDIYKDILRTNVQAMLEKKSTDITVFIKVSENEMRFLKKNFSDTEWIKYLRIDEKLFDGEMVLDDGSASLYEIGLVNQMDVVRSIFIKLLRDRHADS